MAKITLDLNKFKASGVYTVEFDQSERIVVSTEIIRLVVGFSRKGVFNAPVFLQTPKEAEKAYGEIDTYLENRGSYFHRALHTCLQTGPVFALNLLNLDNSPIQDGGDAVEYKSFSLDMSAENGETAEDLLSSFYNKERFWKTDTLNFNAIVDNHPINRGGLFNIVNLGSKPLSILVRKPDPEVNGFNITAREWYGEDNVPEYIDKFDLMKDYFIEVITIRGDWSDYEQLSEDPDYSRYFDKKGIKTDQLDKFLARNEITMEMRVVGSIIPDFTDQQGSNRFIEKIVNATTESTGVFCSINRDMLENYSNSNKKVDMVGHSLTKNDAPKVVEFLSYNSSISSEFEYTDCEDLTNVNVKTYTFDKNLNIYSEPIGGNSGFYSNVIHIPKPVPANSTELKNYQELINTLTPNSIIQTTGSGETEYVKVDSVYNLGTELRIIVSNPENDTEYVNETVEITQKQDSSTIDVDTISHNISANDIVYIKTPNFEGYFKLDGSSTSTSLKISGVADNIETDKYDEVDFTNLTIVPGESFATIIDGSSTDLIPDLNGGNDISIIYSVCEYVTGDLVSSTTGQSGKETLYAYPGTDLYDDIINNRLVDGDIYLDSNSPANEYYIKVNKNKTEDYVLFGLPGVRVRFYDDEALTNQVSLVDFQDGVGSPYTFKSATDLKFKYDVDIISTSASQRTFNISEDNRDEIKVGYLIKVEGEDKLTRVLTKIKKIDSNTGEVFYEISTNAPVELGIGNIESNSVTIVKPINEFAKHLNWYGLRGFELKDKHMPNGTDSRLKEIYGVIENTNIGKTLKSRDLIEFRYIVDTMDSEPQPMMGAKSILSRLAMERQKCMALLNVPSIKKFMESTDPRFTDAPDPAGGNPRPLLNTQYIADGGNLSLGPDFTFSLPDEENGSKFYGAFAPFFTYRDNGKNFNVPPAADISNNFIRKFLNGQPYAIVAGPRRGVISNPLMVGLEHEFYLEDREILEPFGINPIVTVKGVGEMIYANQSGYQKTLSAYNNLHVRDLLITIESAVEDILKEYLFEFNDASTRLEIKSIVEKYLEQVQTAGGLFDFSVIMDSKNNTPEIIDGKFGIIDIGLEPAIGAQKFINRVTILKTGAIASGGFTVA